MRFCVKISAGAKARWPAGELKRYAPKGDRDGTQKIILFVYRSH